MILIPVAIVVVAASAWAMVRFGALQRFHQSSTDLKSFAALRSVDELWSEGVEKIKADRTDPSLNVALEVPPELRHYEDRHWFLATQVAEVRKLNLQNCQDFIDLAAMVERGELVSVPAATENYVLFGVGAKANEDAFTRYQDDHSIGLYDESQLRDAYARIDASRNNLKSEIATLNRTLNSLKTSERAKRVELQKQISAREQQLKTADEERASLDQSYGQSGSRERLFREYESLKTLAKNFAGRSYDLDQPADREAMKLNLLRSLRPAALKILEQVAAAYHDKFNRPLAISSLVRPEEYQHRLRKFNRAAVLIDTPPHSTGLAFDIDYRYLSTAEQNFVMNYLAQLKRDGRIEALRERGANFHVFAFLDGVRPSDDLIKASLVDVDPSLKEENQANDTAADNKKSKAETEQKPSPPAKPKQKKRRR